MTGALKRHQTLLGTAAQLRRVKLQCHPGYVVLFSHFFVFVKSAAAKSPPAFYFIFLQDERLTKPVDLTVE